MAKGNQSMGRGEAAKIKRRQDASRYLKCCLYELLEQNKNKTRARLQSEERFRKANTKLVCSRSLEKG